MPVKIRLQRHGKKNSPYYWIVAADARSKRDGKYLEKLGAYNPTTNPATVELDVDSAVKWLQNGAQPTDTAKAILSYKGALLKKHLAVGVTKGALTEEQAEEKFNAWLDEKEGKIDSKKDSLAKKQADEKAKILEAEKAINDARTAVEVEEAAAETEAETATEEAVVEEAAAEEPKAEETTEAKEEPKAEVKEDKKDEE
ncbi:SSU ribosomal protein S16P [Flavobacteriaceae bacterium MAR_2010_188]|nr:SSU ribosomal protein S16P [Flavobacteriaceae bacterium MAR_2010_188]